METSLFYLLRVSIAATILYLFFKFILSKRTFHAINRIVVLCIVVMTLVLPLFTVKLPEISLFQAKVETTTNQLTVEQVLALLKAGGYINSSTVKSTPATEIPWIKILGVIYLIGFTVALLRFSISFIRMSRIIRLTQKVRLDDNNLMCISDKKVSPFSWMKYIVLSRNDFTDESKDIIRHEQAHVAFGHSYDLLFLDVYSLIFWFNPFAWLLRLELQTIHEYQADEKVLAEGVNAKNYHLSLIRQCVGEYKFALANNFEYNNLHKRIKMTMRIKSSSRQKWLYGTIGLSVMLCIVVLSFNGLQTKAADLKEMIQSELSPAGDSTKQSTPTVVRIRKVVVKNNGTVTPQIIVKDKVVPDPKVKVQIGQNEDTRVVGYGTQLVTESKANHSPLGLNLNEPVKPMIIVDGKEYFQSIDAINPNDILNIQVLKDAFATKTYGDKGKNGVILITTKKNSDGTTNNEIKISIAQLNDDESHKTTPQPLVIIDGKKSSKSFVSINSNDIDHFNVLKDKNGVTIVKAMENAKSSTLKDGQVRQLVDGKEAPANFKQIISVVDIESITVLKDTAATRLYGEKGKNEVILYKIKKNVN